MRTQACSSCGSFFEVKERFVGGIVNCPACGRAAEVAGLRDPRWKGLVAVVAVGWLVWASYIVDLTWGLIPGLVLILVYLLVWLWPLNFSFDPSPPHIATFLFYLVAVVAVGWLFASVLPRLPWWTIPASAMVVVLGSWLEFFLGLHRLLAVTGCLLGWAIMKAAYA